ncbi:tigger transposable element-derived protein 1-like [Periplaneta americana]|uniref:DDE-1 domain-containing protein n=1 Tax=Periplaneta americana TaxID=6978 RepID=A0ABQ8TSB5_PERAM|nr:hypothetical protein ANN_28378 [Periplaneta americana]
MGKYERKTEKTCLTQRQFDEAKRLINERASQRAAAKKVGCSEATLRKRLKLGIVASSMGRHRKVFNEEMEEQLVKHVKDLEARFYGMTRKTLMKVAYESAVQNGLEHRFNTELKLAGKDWVYRFLADWGLSLRTPEQCSLGRAMGFNKVQVDRYFENLKECLGKYKFPPHRLFNMDETGVSAVPDKTAKVVATKGKKSIKKVKSAERGQIVTAVFCVNPTGNFIPPALIFPRKRNKPELYNNSPTGSLGLVSESGYMNSELFLVWLEHFSKHVKSSVDDPVLLVLDNHVSHCSLSAVEFCRQHNIVLLTLPPHASHMLQPLDKVIFAPFKKFYAQEVEKWLCSNPGRAITQMEVSGLFRVAFQRVATAGNAVAAFRDTGIYPYNPHVFNDDDFLPYEVTKIDLPIPEYLDQSATSNRDEDVDKEQEERKQLNMNNQETNEGSTNQTVQPTSSISLPQVPITNIHPLPKYENLNKRKRTSQQSEILTSCPYKNNLVKKENLKQEKEKKKQERLKERTQKQLSKSNPQVSKITKRCKKYKGTKSKTFTGQQLTLGPSTSSDKQTPSEKTYICPGCGESIEEDWV